MPLMNPRLTLKLGRIFIISSLVVLTLFGGFAYRLSQGPLPVPFAKGFIADALQGQSGSQMSIQSVDLVWMGWEQPISVRLREVAMKSPGGDPLAYLPEISVGFSVPHLLVFDLVPQRAILKDPKLVVVRKKNGVFSFSLSESPVFSEGESDASGMFDDISFLRGIQTIDVRGADFVVQDQLRESTWNLSDVDVVLTRNGGVTTFSGRVPLGYSAVNVDAKMKPDGNEIELNLSNLETEKILKFLPSLSDENRAFFNLFEVPVNGRLNLDFSKIMDDPIAGPHLQLKKVEYDLYGGPGVVRLSKFGYQDHVVSMVELSGNLMQDRKASVKLKNLSLDFGDLKAQIKGTLSGGDVDIEANVSDLKMDQLEKYWPKDMAVNPRNWVTKNIPQGEIVEGVTFYKGKISSGDEGIKLTTEDVRGRLIYENLDVYYMGEMPPVKKVSGIAQFKNDRFDLNLNNGVLEGVELKSGVVELTRLYTDRPMGKIDLFVKGPLENVFDVINKPRLGYIDKLGLEKERASGYADLNLNFNLPLLSDLPMEDVGIAVKGDVKNFAYENFMEGYSIRKGDLGLDLDAKGMKISGAAFLNEAKFDVEWEEPFTDNTGSEISLSSRLTPSDTQSLGLDLTGIFEGYLFTDIFISRGQANQMQAKVNLDLENANIDFAGWQKPKSAPGRMFATLDWKNNRLYRIKSVKATAPGLELQMDGRRTASGGMNVNLKKVKIGKTSLSGFARSSRSGSIDVSISGDRLDGGFLLDDEFSSGGSDDQTPISLKAAFGRLSLKSDVGDINNVDLEWIHDGVKTSKLIFGGKMPGDKKIEAGIYPDVSGKGRSRRLWVYSDDAGGFLKQLGIYENVIGGTMSVAGFYDDIGNTSVLDGKMVADNFKLVKAPVVMNLLNLASLPGVQDALRGDGIGFDRMEVPFKKKDDLVTIKDAVLDGPSIGFTANGTYNLDKEKLALTGLLIPANMLNKILGNIPIVGQVLTGLNREGVIAVSYDVKGDANAPSITVNPLTALVPGAIRDLFGAGR